MAQRVCPWWLGYMLASPLRRLWQDPQEILAPYVQAGMVVLEPGPGMGFFTLELARLVGASGRVVAADVQPRMLARLDRRAKRAGLRDRIETRRTQSDAMGIDDLKGKVDFALAFALVHELPSPSAFFAELFQALKPGSLLLLAEPTGHVSEEAFEVELKDAERAGFLRAESPSISMSWVALLKKA